MVIRSKKSVMTKDTTDYYLDRLRAFWSIRKIADRMGVSSATVQRWIDGHTVPSERYLSDFQRVLDELYKSLWKERVHDNDFFGQLCILLRRGGEPEDVEEVDNRRSGPLELDRLDEELERYILAAEKVRSNVLIKAFEKKGYNRMQIYRSADRIGVIKRTKGMGRNMKSWWSLR